MKIHVVQILKDFDTVKIFSSEFLSFQCENDFRALKFGFSALTISSCFHTKPSEDERFFIKFYEDPYDSNLKRNQE